MVMLNRAWDERGYTPEFGNISSELIKLNDETEILVDVNDADWGDALTVSVLVAPNGMQMEYSSRLSKAWELRKLY